MHQIRYFLAVARTLNFTRAAQECGVAQPSLTRAIQLLEAELGGDLFLRERGFTHLTDLGSRMRPLVQQCYDSAIAAKAVAKSLSDGAVAPLKLGLATTIDLSVLVPQLAELSRSFGGLELKFLRGSGADIAERLKRGEADLVLAGSLGADWERFDQWLLFHDPFVLAVNEAHRLARSAEVSLADIAAERLLRRLHCECCEEIDALFRERGLADLRTHEVDGEEDVSRLLAADFGVALVPASMALPPNVRRIPIGGERLMRPVWVYSVVGRPRAPAAGMLIKLLRARDWGAYGAIDAPPQDFTAAMTSSMAMRSL